MHEPAVEIVTEFGEDEMENNTTYEGIWNDNSSLPEQIESDQE